MFPGGGGVTTTNIPVHVPYFVTISGIHHMTLQIVKVLLSGWRMSALDFDDVASDHGGSLCSDIFDDGCDNVNPDLDDIDDDNVAIPNRTRINSNKISDYVE
jgi:hypothetical protein